MTISSMQNEGTTLGPVNQAFLDLQARNDARLLQSQRPSTVTFSDVQPREDVLGPANPTFLNMQASNDAQARSGVRQMQLQQQPTYDASAGAQTQAPNVFHGVPASTTGLFAPLNANSPNVTQMPTHQQAQGQSPFTQPTSQMPFVNAMNMPRQHGSAQDVQGNVQDFQAQPMHYGGFQESQSQMCSEYGAGKSLLKDIKY